MPFKKGNPYGRRFKPGQSGNPTGRPKGMDHIARKILAECSDKGDESKAEALFRELYRLATEEGSVPAIKILMDREWPETKRHELSGNLDLAQTMKDAASEMRSLLSEGVTDGADRSDH